MLHQSPSCYFIVSPFWGWRPGAKEGATESHGSALRGPRQWSCVLAGETILFSHRINPPNACSSICGLHISHSQHKAWRISRGIVMVLFLLLVYQQVWENPRAAVRIQELRFPPLFSEKNLSPTTWCLKMFLYLSSCEANRDNTYMMIDIHGPTWHFEEFEYPF